MPRRPLFACLFLLLAACAGEAPKPVTAPTPAKPEVAIKPAVPIEQPLPAHLRELRGCLLTPPAGSDTYVQVAAGNTFTCAIRSDGVRRCWGDDSHGQAPQQRIRQ